MSLAQTNRRLSDKTRARLKRFLDRLVQECGCRTKAVKIAAQRVGKSPSWIMRIVNEHRVSVALPHLQAVLIMAHCFEPFFKRRKRIIRADNRVGAQRVSVEA